MGTFSNGAMQEWLDAAGKGDLPALKELSATHGADCINYRDLNNGYTALAYAASGGHIHCLNYLLDIGADAAINSYAQTTPLMQAALTNQTACLLRLIEAGNDVNAREHEGWSVLMMAVWKGSRECVDVLLRNDAIIEAYSQGGHSALDVARNQLHHDIEKTLTEWPERKRLLEAQRREKEINTFHEGTHSVIKVNSVKLQLRQPAHKQKM